MALALVMMVLMMVSSVGVGLVAVATADRQATGERLETPKCLEEGLPSCGDGEWVSSCGFISLERGGVVSREVELVKLKVEGNYSIFALVPTEDGIVAVPFKTFFGIPFEEHIKEYTREIDIAFIERKKQLMRVKDSIDVPIIEEFDVEMWITKGAFISSIYSGQTAHGGLW